MNTTQKKLDNLTQLRNRLNDPDISALPIQQAFHKNPWFIPDFTQTALNAIREEMLEEHQLTEWLKNYSLLPKDKTIGLIFAGNIPLVGFHDFLCCYLSGCSMKIKLSSKDEVLFPFLLEILKEIDPELNEKVTLVDRLKDYDAVIATGSNNTNRYFEYYFKDTPKILRANRNSVAVLTGQETKEELEQLADDIFLYFGFGCRNVSKLYVPAGYDLTGLFPRFEKYKWLHDHSKYQNNYDYNRTLLLMNKTPHLANEYLMLIETDQIPSPISTLHYEHWHDERILKSKLKQQKENLQCIVSSQPQHWGGQSEACFGRAQHPALYDYADGIDTLDFLLRL